MDPTSTPLRLPAAPLQDWTRHLLMQAGVPQADAHLTAQALLRTSLRGIDTHGIARLPAYLDKLHAGELNPRPHLRIDDAHGLLRCEGDGGLGQVVLHQALQRCLEHARQRSLVACHIENCGHLGALGVLLLPAVEAGCMALLCQRTPPIMAMPGARAPVIGNNPLAFVAPTGQSAPLVFDMALSAVARGHVAAAAREGRASIPMDWALDASGQPTADPVAALAGAMQPLAGHKGLGLAMLVECLAGSLRSAAPPVALSPDASGSASGVSAFLLVLNPALAVGHEVFDAHLQQWLGHFIEAGGDEARHPGQRQHACEAVRRVDGIPVPPALLAQLQSLAQRAGLPLPLAG